MRLSVKPPRLRSVVVAHALAAVGAGCAEGTSRPSAAFDGECIVASIGTKAALAAPVVVRQRDVTALQASSQPGLTRASAQKLAVDAVAVALSEDAGAMATASMGIDAALATYRAFLRNTEFRVAGPIDKWTGVAALEVEKRRSAMSVEPGPCFVAAASPRR